MMGIDRLIAVLWKLLKAESGFDLELLEPAEFVQSNAHFHLSTTVYFLRNQKREIILYFCCSRFQRLLTAEMYEKNKIRSSESMWQKQRRNSEGKRNAGQGMVQSSKSERKV